jgi:hypothetical protein
LRLIDRGGFNSRFSFLAAPSLVALTLVDESAVNSLYVLLSDRSFPKSTQCGLDLFLLRQGREVLLLRQGREVLGVLNVLARFREK